MAERPIINLDLCNGCGLCVIVCPHKGFVLYNNIIMLVETDDCTFCTECEAVCPTGAISCPYEIVVEEYYEYREIIIEEYYEEG